MCLLPLQLLVLYSEVTVSSELVTVGVTCVLSEPTVTTFATKTSELPSKVSPCDFKYETGVLFTHII